MNSNNSYMLSKENKTNTLKLVDREKIYLTGVIEVVSFDDVSVILRTKGGELTVEGSELHINRLDLAIGEVDISGSVTALVYNDNVSEKSRGLLSIFKR